MWSYTDVFFTKITVLRQNLLPLTLIPSAKTSFLSVLIVESAGPGPISSSARDVLLRGRSSLVACLDH